jgi:hypothetical protein
MMSQSPTHSTDELDGAVLVARHELWRAGDLAWKLDDTQRALYDEIKGCPSALWATEGARKLGKSYAHGVIALETALLNPGKQVNWAAITGKECRLVLLPILEQVSADAPDECQGRHDHENGQWRLPNGAWIQLIGADTRKDCEKGRGPSAILNIVDEAGFHEHLEYLVDSILSPQMRRVRRVVGSFVGMTLLVSTTPYTPAHPFCAMADAGSVRGAYRKLTIWDSGWETREQIEAYIASQAEKKNMDVAAFVATTHFRREYLSERVVDEDIVVFPEMHTKQGVIVREHPRPIGFERFVHKRVAIDLGGMRDKYGFLYGYTDFAAGCIVIEDEALLAKPNTEQVAAEIVEREAMLWPDANPERITRAIDDDTERTIRDLWDLHKVRAFKATKQGARGGRAASIGMIRTLIQMEALVIHPRCVALREQLLTATRNKLGTDFERTTEGHFDLCAALMYFVRDISLTTNPYPPDFSVLAGRALPAHHPKVARREALGLPSPAQGMAQSLLGGNRFTQSMNRRRR